MTSLHEGACRLPIHHITIRVPWHDAGWDGTICRHPLENTSCLVLPRIGEHKREDEEQSSAGQRLDDLTIDLPPCASEHASFMAPFGLSRKVSHPYATSSKETHGHFRPTPFVQPPYSASCIPFRWMLRETVGGSSRDKKIGLAEELRLGWVEDREPDLPFESAWCQERDNQLTLLDTFFGAVRPEESLCFFYAKRTPLSEQSRRVIVGVGRVQSVGRPVEYLYDGVTPPLRSVLWERNIGHSIRPQFADGFLFPYQEIMALSSDGIVDPEDLVAFAPDDELTSFSYGSELLSHDGAVASLIACAAALNRIRDYVVGPWDRVLAWIDTELNRLWKARGAFPGLGSALSAFGFEWGFRHGNLLAYEIERASEGAEKAVNAWDRLDAIMKDPTSLDAPIAKLLPKSMRMGWARLGGDQRALLSLLSRCAISDTQAFRIYDHTSRAGAKIDATNADLIENPYLLFERDRRSPDPIAFSAIDRGLFPDEAIRKEHPIPAPSLVDDPSDPRRVRSLVVDLLEKASGEGHTLLPRSWVIERARSLSLRPGSCQVV